MNGEVAEDFSLIVQACSVAKTHKGPISVIAPVVIKFVNPHAHRMNCALSRKNTRRKLGSDPEEN